MATSRTLQPADQVAHYRVVGPLGAGGMGEVYLAQDQTLERSVALKVLPPELVRSEDRVRRFVQEAKSASSLNHPNIVTIYEIGQDEVRSGSGESTSTSVQYISMELVSGKTLGAKIHDEKADLRTLLGYLAQAAEGIAKAHAAGIVHRDLKPGNIMVSDDGFAKVLDFGLAKLTEQRGGESASASAMTEVADRTAEGMVLGTVHYMSPEQVQGKSVDHRSDIFSFGCMLYEAATRRRPFLADSNVETMHKILHDKPQPIEELNPDVPAELRRLVRRCLNKNPDQRLQSMKDLALELREIVDEYDSLSASATSGSGSGPALALPASGGRSGRLIPIIIAAIVVTVAAIVFGWWGIKHGARDGGHQPFETMRIITQTDRGDVANCAISPDGRYLAYVAGRTNRMTLRVRQVATGSDVEVLPVQDATMNAPSFSPDGNYVFFLKRRADAPNYSSLMSVPSLGGNEQERAFDVDSRVAFSPDQKKVCFVRGYPQDGYSALMLVDLDTRAEHKLATVRQPATLSSAPSWSPDGKSIAALVISLPPNLKTVVALFDPNSGERRDFFTREGSVMESVAWLPDGKGFVLAGFDITATVTNQVFMLSYPEGRFQRVTNDFNNYHDVTVSAGEEAIAVVRGGRLANLYTADLSGGTPRAITSATSPERSPGNVVVSGDRVLYTALRDQFLSLFSLPVNGGTPAPVIARSGFVTQVRAAPGKVIFTFVEADQQMHIWRADLDGGRMRQLSKGTGETLIDLSPDGSLFTFSRNDSTRGVWIMPTDGGDARLLSPTALKGRGGFSPDGNFVATLEFETDDQGLIRTATVVYPVAGGDVISSRRVPAQATNVKWLPGSNGMSFVDRADPAWNVYSLEHRQTDPEKITKFTDGRITDLEWSPDGNHIAIVRRLGNGENVWVTNADGTAPKQITNFTGQEVFQILWTPDSQHIITNAGQTANDAALIKDFR